MMAGAGRIKGGSSGFIPLRERESAEKLCHRVAFGAFARSAEIAQLNSAIF